MDVQKLAIDLTEARTEDDVIAILTREGVWSDYAYWRPFGDNDNNFSTIGNQQSRSDAALVEKLINSVDAILMKECMIRGIAVDSEQAPQSMSAAISDFFQVRDGQMANLDKKTRNRLSENIILAATGMRRGCLNLIIADKGEGQTPNRLPDTILSLSKNNKLKVPFVQGKFNMGGTGVLPFCGKHHFQLVISKRCPDLPRNNDDSFDEWAFTIVRREDAREGRRSTMYTYLTDEHQNILRFSAPHLQILPTPQGQPYENMEYGTYFKLFNYTMAGRYKSNIQNDLNYRLSMLMPDLAHPIRIKECRDYNGHSFEVTLSGLQTRLTDDRSENVEPGFPTSDTFSVDGQQFKVSIYVFKKGHSENYREKDGILYVINGQTHACISDSFFNRVNLSYLADSMLILVDCSTMDVLHREDMFMNSRDRLRSCEFVKEVEEQLKDILRNHAGLKKLQNERRSAAVQERLSDDRPLQEVLQSILTRDPVLSRLFISGTRLTNPFNTNTRVGVGDQFVGKKHPTFFRPNGKVREGVLYKKVPVNNKYYRLQFETDVENDYFARPVESGSLEVTTEGVPCPSLVKHLGLYNGVATLDMLLPENASVNDIFYYEVKVIDDCLFAPLECKIALSVTEEENHNSGGNNGSRVKPRDPNKPGNRENPETTSAMPNITEVRKDRWEAFGMTKDSALIVRRTDDASDYFLNMDNQYLLTELKNTRDANKIALTNARYKYSMALIGMGVESHLKQHRSEEESDPAETVAKVSQMIAPILIPMIESMAELDIGQL